MIPDRLSRVSQSVNDRCSAIAHAWSQTTFPNSSAAEDANADFSHIVPTPSGSIAITSDGIGTKVEIAERMERYDTLGFDLVAMVIDDLVAGGSRPIALSNILDVDRFDEAVIDDLMRGLATAARMAQVVVAGGEIAQLGSRISGFGKGMHANWCSTAIGVPMSVPESAHRTPKAGDRIIAFGSDGFRSNGFTLVRSILDSRLGEDWHREKTTSGMSWGEALLTPSRIYAPAIVSMIDAGVSVIASAHITGGGIPGNLPRMLKGVTLRAELDDLWPPHPAMIELAQMADIDPKDAYGQWNMGTGYLCIVATDEISSVLSQAEDFGIRARNAGKLVEGDGLRIDARAWGMGDLVFGGNT
jgi:phosphoribosylformylglycinamidine cyclo-ligase